MASALVAGIRTAGIFRPEEIAVTDVMADKCAKLARDYGIASISNNSELAEACDIIVLAVKPGQLFGVLSEIRQCLSSDRTVVSIVAGIAISRIAVYLPKNNIVRAMPNTPSLIGRGVTALSWLESCPDEVSGQVKDIFTTVGDVVCVDESMMAAITALSGSGPAYVYIMLESMADAGVRAGLPRDLALRISAMTVAGAGEMVFKTGKHPAILKDMVTSPSGTTIEALHSLEDDGFRASVMKAVAVAYKRACEISVDT